MLSPCICGSWLQPRAIKSWPLLLGNYIPLWRRHAKQMPSDLNAYFILPYFILFLKYPIFIGYSFLYPVIVDTVSLIPFLPALYTFPVITTVLCVFFLSVILFVLPVVLARFVFFFWVIRGSNLGWVTGLLRMFVALWSLEAVNEIAPQIGRHNQLFQILTCSPFMIISWSYLTLFVRNCICGVKCPKNPSLCANLTLHFLHNYLFYIHLFWL
jgi:hypothetical protein